MDIRIQLAMLILSCAAVVSLWRIGSAIHSSVFHLAEMQLETLKMFSIINETLHVAGERINDKLVNLERAIKGQS